MRCKVELSYKILMRYFWISLGCISFILGTIGIILPLLPTVPFYLLLLFLFLSFVHPPEILLFICSPVIHLIKSEKREKCKHETEKIKSIS